MDIDPLGLLLGAVWLFAVGMFPVGIMLGSSCSPCCQQGEPCSLQGGEAPFYQYSSGTTCDGLSSVGGFTYGVKRFNLAPFDQSLRAYFDSDRARQHESTGEIPTMAYAAGCESICNKFAALPVYSFAGTIPTVTMSLSFPGPTTEYKAYWSKMTPEALLGSSNCYGYTTISQFSGQYALTHVGRGVFRYATEQGDDSFEVVASLHRCNNVAMWLISVAFVSRTVRSKCGGVQDGNVFETDTELNNSACEWLLQNSENVTTVNCCFGHVLQFATLCVRTEVTFPSKVSCPSDGESPGKTFLLDTDDPASLGASGTLSVQQRATSSNADEFNITNRAGAMFSTSEGAPCYCGRQVNTFWDVVGAPGTIKTAPFTLTVT